MHIIRFSRSWFNIPEFSPWLEESPIPGYAFCKVCRKDLHPGKSELLKHSNTAKHKKRISCISDKPNDPLNNPQVMYLNNLFLIFVLPIWALSESH